MNSSMRYPEKQGLYDPNLEHDSCGVGFIVDMHNRASTTSSGRDLNSSEIWNTAVLWGRS